MSPSYPVMEKRGPIVDESRIARFETAIDRKLPADYREFLISVNGGVPEDVLAVPTGKNATLLQVLYGLDASDRWMNIEKVLENLQLRDEGKYPPDALPIGNDGLGNKFVLAVGGERRGEVFFQALDVHPDRRLDTEWYRTRQFKRIAGSFSEFIASLTTRPEGA